MKPYIFYLDDETVLLDVFRAMFADEYEVQTASTLSEARSTLSQCAPDIIISDLSMPEISGIDFLREAAQLYPDSFRILLTGFAQVGDVIEEIGEGVIQVFMPKPWKEDQMRRTLERVALTRKRPQAEDQ